MMNFFVQIPLNCKVSSLCSEQMMMVKGKSVAIGTICLPGIKVSVDSKVESTMNCVIIRQSITWLSQEEKG